MVKFVKVVSSDGRTLTVEADDGETYSLHGNVAWRANNPGNLRPGSLTNDLGAIGTIDTGSNGKFLVFPDRETGEKARQTLLFETPTYANKTLLKAIQKYAPAGDNNNPEAYAASLAYAAGVNVNTKISDLTPAQKQAIMQAQLGVEDSRPGTISAAAGRSVPPEVARQFSGIPLPPAGLPMDAGQNVGGGVTSAAPAFSQLGPAAMNGVGRLNPGQRAAIPAMDTEASVSASGVGSLSDPRTSSLTSPALDRALARLGQAVGGKAAAGQGINGSASLTAATAPQPMPGRPADAQVIQASAEALASTPQTIRVGKHDYQIGQTFDQGGMHYRVTPTGIVSSRIPTGEPTIMSGVIGQIAQQEAPKVAAALNTAATKAGNSLSNMGTNIGKTATDMGSGIAGLTSSLGSTIGNFLQPSKSQSNLSSSASSYAATGTNAGTTLKPAVVKKPTLGVMNVGGAVANGGTTAHGTATLAPAKPMGGMGALAGIAGGVGGSALRATAPVVRAPAPRPIVRVSAVPTVTLAQINAAKQPAPAPVAPPSQPVGASYLQAQGQNTKGMTAGEVGNALKKSMGIGGP